MEDKDEKVFELLFYDYPSPPILHKWRRIKKIFNCHSTDSPSPPVMHKRRLKKKVFEFAILMTPRRARGQKFASTCK